MEVFIYVTLVLKIFDRLLKAILLYLQICSGLNANEIQIAYDKHHKVSSLVKSHINTHKSVKYEVVGTVSIK